MVRQLYDGKVELENPIGVLLNRATIKCSFGKSVPF